MSHVPGFAFPELAPFQGQPLTTSGLWEKPTEQLKRPPWGPGQCRADLMELTSRKSSSGVICLLMF